MTTPPTTSEMAEAIMGTHADKLKELWSVGKGSEKYRARQYATFKAWSTEPQDWQWNGHWDELRDNAGMPTGTCDLCGHQPIAYKFSLILVKPEHPKKGSELGVGSECVTNYHLAAPDAEKVFRHEVQVIRRYRAVTNKLMKVYGTTHQAARDMARVGNLRVDSAVLMYRAKDTVWRAADDKWDLAALKEALKA